MRSRVASSVALCASASAGSRRRIGANRFAAGAAAHPPAAAAGGEGASLYLAVLRNVDPTPVAVIGKLKAQLAKKA